LLRFTVLPKLAPPSVLLLYQILVTFRELSFHTTYALFPDAATDGTSKDPLWLTIIDGSKEIVFLLNRI
jgi:hypothetical protein